jgi:hypothetical protein
MGSRYDAGDDSDIMPEMTGHFLTFSYAAQKSPLPGVVQKT